MARCTAIIVLFVGIIIYLLISSSKVHPDVLKSKVSGKKVLITGASSGIGEQVAYHYARLGANVFITARRKPLLQKVVSKLKEINPEGMHNFAVADMAKAADAENLISIGVHFLGGVDILVLNHGMLESIGFWSGSSDNITQLAKHMTVNFESYIWLVSAALPHLKSSEGQIAVVSSVTGELHVPSLAIYTSTKHALNGFFRTLRSEFLYQNLNISVTIFMFSLIDTDLMVDGERKVCAILSLPTLCFRPFASPVDAAEVLVSSVAEGKDDVWWPPSQHW